MRILGIDYGRKRIGLSLSDETGILAFPFNLFKKVPPKKGIGGDRLKIVQDRWAREELIAVSEEIKEICRVEKVESIVIGLPLDLAGRETPLVREVKEFVSLLEKITKRPVVFEKEFLTTKLAEQKFKEAGIRKFKEKIDAAAAAEILQSYLDKIRAQK